MICCQSCQAENADANRFCEDCGGTLELVCVACGAVARASARFCAQCGAAMSAGLRVEATPTQMSEGGERKQVTVLFADIRGSTQLIQALDPESAMQQLDPTLQLMTHSVAQFGGVVNSVQGDGIMALFGVPIATEDHAVQACLAALMMIESAQRLNDPNIQLRVGIDSGEVIVRSTGRDPSDYAATGVVAHIAHRVEQQAAPGSVFITGRTARLARGYIGVTALGRVAIKGLAARLEVFQLLSAVARPSWEVRGSVHALTRFIGRHPEMSQMSAALVRAGLGCGQVVTLVADAGFGKSRLVYEFLRTLPSGSWNVLRVAALSHTAQAPYQLAAELLRSWLAIDASDDRAEVARKFENTVALIDPNGSADLAPLRLLLDLPMAHDDWQPLAPSVRRQRLMGSLRTVVLREAALRPVILLVEDYHWVDLPSAELLDAMVASMGAARLLLLVTTRPERVPAWSGRSYCLQLPLPALEPENARSLLQELLGPSTQGPLQQQILAQAGGVPLFIEEIVRSLSENGLATEAAADPSLESALAAGGIPASVQVIIAARIDRLPATRRRLLHIASVIGKDFPLNLLEAVANLPRAQIDREIAALQAAEFLCELSLPSGTEYTFRHVLIQTVAYEEMLMKQRRELHARVVACMETLCADRLDELTERLADHALRGEAWAAAVCYALKAGDRAVGRGAWRDAVRYYDNAIAALEHLPVTPESVETSIEARLRLRVALPGLGDLPRIARCLEEARGLAEHLDNPARLVEIDTSQCLTLTKMGRLEQAVEAGQRGYDAASRLGEPAGFLNASFALAQAYWYHGRFREAEQLVVERLPAVRGELRLRNTGTTGTASVLALVCLSKTFAITGQAGKAFETIAEARDIASDTRKAFDLSYCHVGRGFCLLMADEPDAAVGELEAGLRLARAGDIALLIPSSQRYLGRAYALVGRLKQADDVLNEAIERTTASGLLGMRLWSMAALAEAQLLGRVVEAHEIHKTLLVTLDLAQQQGFRPLQARVLRLIGTLHALSDAPETEAWYRRAADLAVELGMVPEAALTNRNLTLWLGHVRPTDESTH